MVIRAVASSLGITYGGTSCDLVAGEWVVVELYEPNWLVTFLGVFSVIWLPSFAFKLVCSNCFVKFQSWLIICFCVLKTKRKRVTLFR